MKPGRLIQLLMTVVLLHLPLHVKAESRLVTGAGAATARALFGVAIASRLFLAVGTGESGPRVTNPTIDTVTFNYTGNPTAVGTGAAASAITGNLVRVAVYSNRGAVGLSVTNPVNLTNGPDVIPFTQITVTSNAATLPAPVMSGPPVYPTPNGANITNRSATWTFRYSNTVLPAGGVFSGQVTYTLYSV